MSFSEKLQTIKYSKLSELKKVELLEEAVLNGTVEDLKTVIENCKSFEYTARALGIACRYGSYEKAKLLIENGASFKYNSTPAMKRKYDFLEEDFSYTITANFWRGYFTRDTSISLRSVSDEERAEILRLLLRRKVKGFSPGEILDFALRRGDDIVANILLDKNIDPPYRVINMLSETGRSDERDLFLRDISSLSADRCLSVLTLYTEQLKKRDKKIVVTQQSFDGDNNPFWNANVFQYVIENADTSKLTKSKLLEGAVSRNAISVLEIMINAGWLKGAAKRDKLIDFARENKCTEALAWLMDYKNRTADFEKEAQIEQAKLMRELTEKPDSVSALKRSWTYKKLDDGTLQINKYKGNASDVVVPERIGKDTVSTIAGKAFSYSDEIKRKVVSVVIPDSVTNINYSTFEGCTSLTSITIPNSVTNIYYRAFEGCTSLTNITIPDSVKEIAGCAFKGCTSLISITIPDSVTKIGWDAFRGCTSLTSITIPDSVTEIGSGAFEGCTGLDSVTIPNGVKEINSIFEGCTGLTSITIPRSVKEIYGFYGCSNLKTVYTPSGSYAEEYMKKEFPNITVVNI